MDVFMLPSTHLGKWLGPLQARRAMQGLARIPAANEFCGIRLETKASGDLPKGGSWIPLERAVATLNEVSAARGWMFFMITGRGNGAEDHVTILTRITAPSNTRQAINALTEMARKEDPDEAYLHDIGARGRRRLYETWARYPVTYALGIRMKKAEVVDFTRAA